MLPTLSDICLIESSPSQNVILYVLYIRECEGQGLNTKCYNHQQKGEKIGYYVNFRNH